MAEAPRLDFVLRSAEWSYDAILRNPIFRLARDGAQILEIFYGILNSRVRLTSSSLSLFGGAALSDIRLRIQLFGGAGSIELMADRYTFAIRNISSQADIDLVVLCSGLGRQALERVIDRSEVVLDSFAMRGHLELLGEKDQAQQLLERFSIVPEGLEDLAPGRVRGGVHLDLSDASTGWICSFDVQASSMIENGLFWALSCSYTHDCVFSDYIGRQEHFLSLARALPATYGLVARHEVAAPRSTIS